MKKLLLIPLLLLSFNADAYPPQPPKKCPSADEIAKTTKTIIVTTPDPFGLWTVAFANNTYDTENTWTFVAGKMDAEDADDAQKKALQILNSLVFSDGPAQIPRMKRWRCTYSNDSNYVTVTTTPSLDGTP